MAARTKSLATAALVDTDGFKTSIATAATAQSYSGAALNGAAGNGTTGPAHGFAYMPTATLASNAGSYVAGSAITFVGLYRGRVTTRTGLIVGTDGNETVTADGPLEGPLTSIGVAAQVNTGGAFLFGWTDALPRSRDGAAVLRNAEDQWPQRLWSKIVGTATGNLHLGYPGDVDDTVPVIAGQEVDVNAITRLYATGTTAACTIYSD